MSLHIEGRRWFEKTNGNTYHSVRIFSCGKEIAHAPYVYGYGDHYMQTAWELMKKYGEETRDYHVWRSRMCSGGGSVSVIDVQRKKDL